MKKPAVLAGFWTLLDNIVFEFGAQGRTRTDTACATNT